MKNTDEVLLVGTGPMAIEYAKVLKGLKKKIVAVGQNAQTVKDFEGATGIKAKVGGIEKWLDENESRPRHAIVVVNENLLGNITIKLIEYGFKSILVEKPGGRDPGEVKKVAEIAKKHKAKVFVGYNRRFYASVMAAEKIIKEDKGVTSFNFEFTEWGFKIAPLEKAPGVKEVWFYHNSTHVVDLAFFLGGMPVKICPFVSGSLSWHPDASVFAGAGLSEKKAIFSYQANWESPGRWSVEILTKKHRLILRPMEILQIQNIGSVQIEPVKIDDKLDIKYKPGLYGQVKAYLENEKGRLCTIEEQAENIKIYKKILGK